KVERADGARYQVYAQKDGRKVYVGSYASKREAQSADEDHRVTQRKIATGELAPEVDMKRTLTAAMDEWLASLKARGSRSHGGYRDRARIYITPALGSVAVARLTRSQVMRWRDEQAVRFSPATVNGNLTALSSAYQYFIDRQWIDANPCHGVAQIESPDRLYTWIQTHEEITKLLLECPKGIREIATLALGTGMRLDELLHLQWADVDIERRLISVHRGRQGTVKSGKARRVPILNSMLSFVRGLALQRDGHALVFPGENGKPRSKPGVRYPFKQAADRAGFSKALRFHDLRHTFASHWVLDGGDIFRLSKLLGHSNVTVTQKVYAHLAPEAWERDYHRVSFTVPDDGAVYGMTKRRALVAVP
ncbi:MAG: site-specific integrase, partial [Proteobacteria bacterium]|nr:site-specific integrase [Pseudomonadota bacterium]